jgi:hemolysin III
MLASRPTQLEVEVAFPLLRGVFHQYLLVLLIPATVALAAFTPPPARVAAAVYAISLLTCVAVSTTLHRRAWSPRGRDVMSRIDHSTIFLLIAGSGTPVAAFGLSGTLQAVTFACFWGGGAIGIAMSLFRSDWHPAVEVAPYLLTPAMGWVDLPVLMGSIGVAPTVLIIVGGGLYVIGALIYGAQWPDPWPRTLGYHEIFHLCTVAAMILQFIAILGWVLPLAR